MFDDVCDALRNVIIDAIESDVCCKDSILRGAVETKGMSINFTDDGLSIEVDGRLYGIFINRV